MRHIRNRHEDILEKGQATASELAEKFEVSVRTIYRVPKTGLKMDFSKVEFMTYTEGTCVQIMHVGPYDEEPASIALMEKFAEESGYVNDITDKRMHHEIYLSDARKVAPERLKTVIRHPVRKIR